LPLRIGLALERGPLRGLTGIDRWSWRRRGLGAEFYRCALRAREMRSPGRALTLCLRSIAMWPSPFFMPNRYKFLLVYLLRPKFAAPGRGMNKDDDDGHARPDKCGV